MPYTYNREKSAERIRQLRISKSLTQKELADRIGVGLRTYTDIERGCKDITAQVLIEHCDYYAISADFILGLSDTKYTA